MADEQFDATRLKEGEGRPIVRARVAGEWRRRGRLLPEPARSHLEALLGWELRDVRVHDYHQAAVLARRLGAEAFAFGHHVFGSRQSLEWSTPQGLALLAHELAHVAQQTAPLPSHARPLALGQRPGGVPRPKGAPLLPRPGTGDGSASVPLAPYAAAPRSPGVPRLARATPAADRAAGGETGEDEAEAVAAERVVRQAAGPARRGRRGAAPLDASAVADRVYRLMCQELRLLRERAALP